MKTEALSIIIPAPKNAVIHYLADIENFPEWATEFCQGLIKNHNHYKIKCPMGEVFFRIHANKDNGEIKYFATQEPDGSDYLPSKVIPISDTSCEYVINFSQQEDIPNDVYQQQCRAIMTELQNIQNNFTQ